MTQSKTKKSDAAILDSLADLDQAITDGGGQPGGLAEALADLVRRNGVTLATAKPKAETGPAESHEPKNIPDDE
jgi:hypothetical protein